MVAPPDQRNILVTGLFGRLLVGRGFRNSLTMNNDEQLLGHP
jgi:hypothetical protein